MYEEKISPKALIMADFALVYNTQYFLLPPY